MEIFIFIYNILLNIDTLLKLKRKKRGKRKKGRRELLNEHVTCRMSRGHACVTI